MTLFQYHGLRPGKRSRIGRPYLVTFFTAHGAQYFSDERLASTVCRQLSLAAFRGHTQNWCFVVMPDHVHWLCSLADLPLWQVVRTVMSEVNEQTGLALWEDGLHPIALGSEEALLPLAQSMLASPIRAGLVRRIGDYPFWDAAWL